MKKESLETQLQQKEKSEAIKELKIQINKIEKMKKENYSYEELGTYLDDLIRDEKRWGKFLKLIDSLEKSDE